MYPDCTPERSYTLGTLGWNHRKKACIFGLLGTDGCRRANTLLEHLSRKIERPQLVSRRCTPIAPQLYPLSVLIAFQ
jgi:hypothetical protein